MKRLYQISIFLLVIGLVSGCSNTGRRSMENNIRFDSIALDKKFHYHDVVTNPECSLKMKFVYPCEYQDDKTLKQLQRQFNTSFFGEEYAIRPVQEAMQAFANETVDDFNNNLSLLEDGKEFEADGETAANSENLQAQWLDAENKVLYNANGLISLSIIRSEFVGGAHPDHSIKNQVISLNGGVKVQESEIFTEGYESELAKIIVKAIADYRQVSVSELEDLGYFSVNEIAPNKNFYVDDTGITYTFNYYEIAPYAVGATTVTIPYGKIRHLMRPENPIASIAF
ncbi:MAG: DUF3298 and DUF4163 domain-containing protein [Tannerella sp.]|jgi:hypothetical protein|nr:DUF3298 and DUF4163 domain-containing protein [Tannerella sp.]